MATTLTAAASSAYIAAQNALRKGKPEIYVYVEGKQDVPFWTECVAPFSAYKFVVTHLKTNGRDVQGKLDLLNHVDIATLGRYKWVAVDADFDWIIDDYRPSPTTPSYSREIWANRYILHTYLHSIENYKCHPAFLSSLMVAATGSASDGFALYMAAFSKLVAPLFLLHLVSLQNCDGVFSIKQFSQLLSGLGRMFPDMRISCKATTGKFCACARVSPVRHH
jgi:hypothetical protein